MAVRLIPDRDAGPLSGVYAEIRRMLGIAKVPNIFQAMAGINPDVLVQNWTAYRRTMIEGELPRSLKEMIGLVVARESRSAYSLVLHAGNLLLLGTEREAVAGLKASGETITLPERSRAVLAFARRHWKDPAAAGTEELEAVGLTEDQAAEVVDTLFIVVGMSQFALECGMPLDDQRAG